MNPINFHMEPSCQPLLSSKTSRKHSWIPKYMHIQTQYHSESIRRVQMDVEHARSGKSRLYLSLYVYNKKS